jgi:hypothetical protein
MGEGSSFHFNSNIRTNSGSRATMSNNEDRYLRALEIQERKQAILDEALEKQKEEEAKLAALKPKVEEDAAVAEEAPKETIEAEVLDEPEEAPAVEKEAPAPVAVASSGTNVPGPTPRSDFSSEEKSAMLKRAKAHAAEVAKRKK